VIPWGPLLAVGTGYSVITPAVVMRPILFPAYSVNHSAPSGPAVIPPGLLDVLRLLAKGMRNKEIAGQLGISEKTAEGHVKSILSKFGLHDRTEAVAVAVRRGSST